MNAAALAASALAVAVLMLATGDPARVWLLFGLTAVWGVRLAAHIGLGSLGKGEDPRYGRLLDDAPGGRNAYARRTGAFVPRPPRA
ncbi:DUF1295 domain-containing protein [Nocardiopsis sp. FR6]|uniref:DUF1295 domain-containing protein n=1 Tax=unclassified Nocardiopsis TaxID=2649073 RepID=UPI00351A9D31